MNCRNTTKSKDADKGRKANTSREANSRSDNSNSIMTPLETVGTPTKRSSYFAASKQSSFKT